MSKKKKNQINEMDQALFRQETDRNHFSSLIFKKHYKYLTDEEKKAINDYIVDWYKPKWRTVVYNGQEISDYKVSNVGTVMNVKTTKILKGRKNEFGYIRDDIKISNNRYKSAKIHRLVAEAFIPNPDNKSIVINKDGNYSNNKVDNLMWCTLKEARNI